MAKTPRLNKLKRKTKFYAAYLGCIEQIQNVEIKSCDEIHHVFNDKKKPKEAINLRKSRFSARSIKRNKQTYHKIIGVKLGEKITLKSIST